MEMNANEDLANIDLNKQKIALFIGSEENGLSKEIQNKLDLIVKINMSNKVESLNASVAAAIAMNQFFKKNSWFTTGFAIILLFAGVAQWPEQPTCNRQVRGSTPLSGSKWLIISKHLEIYFTLF